LREREYTFLNGDEFPRMLAAHDVALIRPAGGPA
jgi:hypothetical protein